MPQLQAEQDKSLAEMRAAAQSANERAAVEKPKLAAAAKAARDERLNKTQKAQTIDVELDGSNFNPGTPGTKDVVVRKITGTPATILVKRAISGSDGIRVVRAALGIQSSKQRFRILSIKPHVTESPQQQQHGKKR